MLSRMCKQSKLHKRSRHTQMKKGEDSADKQKLILVLIMMMIVIVIVMMMIMITIMMILITTIVIIIMRLITVIIVIVILIHWKVQFEIFFLQSPHCLVCNMHSQVANAQSSSIHVQNRGQNSSVGSAWARCPQCRGFDPPLGTFSGRGDFSLGVNMGSNSIPPKTLSDESINRGLVCAHMHFITRTQKILTFMS